LSIFAGMSLEGCGWVRNVMSFSRPTSGTTTTTTTTVTKTTRTTQSDVVVPGHPLVAPSPGPKKAARQASTRAKGSTSTPAPKLVQKEPVSPKGPAKGTKSAGTGTKSSTASSSP